MRKMIIVIVIGHDTISSGEISPCQSSVVGSDLCYSVGNYLKICQECQIDLLPPPYAPLHQILVNSGQAFSYLARYKVQSGSGGLVSGVVIISQYVGGFRAENVMSQSPC